MRIIITLLLAAMLPANALAATTVITVTGQGTASAMPDTVTESFTISTSAPAAAQAMSENNSRYNRLAGAMHNLGVPNADVQTTSYGLTYTPRPGPGETPEPGERYGYAVSRSIDVTLHDTALTGKAIDAAAAAGVTDVGGVTFSVSDRKGQLSAALRAAVSDAHQQAQAMASAAGLRIIGIKRMQQGYQNVPPPQPVVMRTMAVQAPVPTEIQPSAIQAQAAVTITYLAQ